ncbi:hypothetical protein TrVFT333_000886 [Trichoderma virens FT-333]|nr:hypothetical protein TrVFT333_000886 [Trichoderma virens FT-333]
MAEIISAIQSRLRKAQQEAAKMEADFITTPLDVGVSTPDLKTMRVRMTGFLDKRKVQAAKTIEGIKWAFYKKDKHEKFITEISALIKHLERKVNTIKESQRLDDTRIMYIARARTSIM